MQYCTCEDNVGGNLWMLLYHAKDNSELIGQDPTCAFPSGKGFPVERLHDSRPEGKSIINQYEVGHVSGLQTVDRVWAALMFFLTSASVGSG